MTFSPDLPRPSGVGVEPALGPLGDLERYLAVVLQLAKSELVVSDAEGIAVRLSWSGGPRRLEAVFPFGSQQIPRAQRIVASLRELSIEPREKQGRPKFLRFVACDLEPESGSAAAVVGRVLSRALSLDAEEMVAYMALDRESGEWLPLAPRS